MAKRGETLDILSIRKKTKLTQEEFAKVFGFGLPSLRNWEQGRGGLTKSTHTYLRLIEENPQQIMELVRKLSTK